jgi:outer membrane murein-binding lipoprotein Lpp
MTSSPYPYTQFPTTSEPEYDVVIPAPRPPVADAPVPSTPPRKRPVLAIALSTATALGVIAAVVLAVLLSGANSRADKAQSLADRRADQISTLNDNVDALEGQVSTLTQQKNSAQADASAAQAEAASVKQQAGRPAYLYTILSYAPSIYIAGESSVLDLGQAVCSAEGRGASRDAIIAAGEGSFPHDQNVAMVTAAEDFLC